MKIKYLGTSAAEGFPSVFCNCKSCNEAHRLGGRDIRTRSQMIINDDLLIDLPPDTYMHSIIHGVRLDAVKNFLITHSHLDHYYPEELNMRGSVFASGMRAGNLNVFSNETVYGRYQVACTNTDAKSKINWRTVEPYISYNLGQYSIIPLPANHMKKEQALIYIISKQGKSILYGNDTGFLFEEVFDFIEKQKIKFNVISLDCTMANHPVDDSGSHMGFDGCKRTADRLKKIGAVEDGCRVILTHFSHNGNLTHEEMCNVAEKLGMEIAYDGFTVEL